MVWSVRRNRRRRQTEGNKQRRKHVRASPAPARASRVMNGRGPHRTATPPTRLRSPPHKGVAILIPPPSLPPSLSRSLARTRRAGGDGPHLLTPRVTLQFVCFICAGAHATAGALARVSRAPMSTFGRGTAAAAPAWAERRAGRLTMF
ncbi:hypothetical protein R5R35_007194 [Gryllus longicercus]|uniref:Uncharacterized protein n=1 Tax=Gryllus longicercus TaxID=2509291 RepID=A0AAN9VQQ4_9ORTH